MKNYLHHILTVYFLFILCSLFGQEQLGFKKIKEIPSSSNINCLLAIGDQLYIGANNAAYEIKNDIVTPIIKDKNIIDFAASKDSMLFLTDGIKIYDYKTRLPLTVSRDLGNITSIEMFANSLYVGTSTGLAIVQPKSGKAELKTIANSALKSNAINFIYADNKGKCWIGTEKGEIRIENNKWQLDHKDQNVTDVYENKEGLWFTSLDSKNKRQLYLIDHFNRGFDAGYGDDLAKGKFNDFCIDNNGILYFASDDFRSYDPYDSKIHSFSKNTGYIAAKATATAVDMNNQLWLGTEGNGLFRAVKGDVEGLVINCIAESQPKCNNGKSGVIKIIADGGKAPYTYKWPNDESKTDRAEKLPAGNYIVTVFDQLGASEVCIVDLVNPDHFFVDLVSMSAVSSESDGRIEIQPIGGNGPYTYKWDNGNKTATLSNIKAGNYAVTITDKNGCVAKGEYSLTKEKILSQLKMDKVAVGKILNIEDLSFKADSSIILASSYKVLDEITSFLQSNKSLKIEVGGHTNTIPSHEYCDKLSQARAESVARYFYSKGIEKDRIIPKGYGKRNPILTGNTAEARQKNQRVEIKFLAI
jgi:outer membrane protein OmpA-like peptidoglycan-associated protein